MDTEKFLRLVVSSGDLLGLTRQWDIDGKKTISNHPVRTHRDLAAAVLALDKKNVNVWYALASYSEQAKYKKGGKLRLYRKAKYADSLKSVWLDIDFKNCSLAELKPRFAQFLKATKLPLPSLIVDSGGGWHVYWCLSEAIPPEKWVPLAQGLKRLCKEHDFPADHACTSDLARILRPVGTYNYKYDPPRPVQVIGGTKKEILHEVLSATVHKNSGGALPVHLRGKAVDANEYSQTGFVPREVDTKRVIRDCGVLRHVLKTGGAECSEPMWSLILLLLRFLPGGAKLVHPLSQGHIGYNAQETNDKWQSKLRADVSGPPFCARFQEEYGEKKCVDCPIYRSKIPKNPLALGDVPDRLDDDIAKKSTPGASRDYPNNWRPIPGNKGVERKSLSKKGEWEWVQVLRRTWRLEQAQKSANTGEYTYIVKAMTVTGKPIDFEIPGSVVYGCPKTWEVLGVHGAILTAGEKQHWTDLMATWLQKIQEENAILDTVDQLGWIEREDSRGNRKIFGFSSGGVAFFNDGTVKRGAVAANHKHKGIASYYTPIGDLGKWRCVSDFFLQQGHMHIVTMIASAFAGPLIKFTGQSGAIMSLVSSGTSAGKSLSLETAASVWGDPKLGTMTLNDTPTSIKNKIAYLKNITAYWDEVRGNERVLHEFIQIAFQVTQGKDRERADRLARTVVAQKWHTLLVCTSNDSIFDLAASETGVSDAGVYRIFELLVNEDEKPSYDASVASLVAELQNNFGSAGKQYAEYLAKNVEKVRGLVAEYREKIERRFDSAPAERFWIATMASIIVGAVIAKRLGLCDFDLRALWEYLSQKFIELRGRVIHNKNSSDPKELLVAYMMENQAERLVVDKLKIGRGGQYHPIIIGNIGHIRRVTYQIGKDQNILRVVKQDFVRWLYKTRNFRLSGTLRDRFVKDCKMTEVRCVLGAATPFATSRAVCLDFSLDTDPDGGTTKNTHK